ncbi:MAG: GNAT family N-acetyltransferase [Planctomycetes bacterium]|nr:GNAT family N-acetyltransferase [Planctomycetota bacterium]
MFYDHEVDVAVELVDERFHRGPASGYSFIFAEMAGRVVGYACYGPIACTAFSYDLYWIAVHKDCQGRGFGRLLLREAERRIAAAGGRRIYVETSCRQQYLPTRAFYEHHGYVREATLADFYGPEDAKAVYVKPV